MDYYNPCKVQVFATPSNGGSEVILTFANPAFMKAVMGAACSILEHCHPHSDLYKDPTCVSDGSVGDVFNDDADRLDALAGCVSSTRIRTHGQLHYLVIHHQLDLLIQYVEMRNAARKNDMFYVGEEYYHMQYVYSAICAFHAWKVQAIEAGIQKNGTEFGSETGWFKTSYKEYVEDWPDQYSLSRVRFDVPELPVRRADWQQRREKHFNSRVAVLLESEPSPITVSLRRHAALDRGLDPGLKFTVWSFNPDDMTIQIHNMGADFDPEVHVSNTIKYDDVGMVGNAYVRF